MNIGDVLCEMGQGLTLRWGANASTKLSERERFNSSNSRCGWKSGYRSYVIVGVEVRGGTRFRESGLERRRRRRTGYGLEDTGGDLPVMHKRG